MRSCIPSDFSEGNENERQTYDCEQIPKTLDYNPSITSFNQILTSEKVQNHILQMMGGSIEESMVITGL
jgi:hypothetical protein